MEAAANTTSSICSADSFSGSEGDSADCGGEAAGLVVAEGPGALFELQAAMHSIIVRANAKDKCFFILILLSQ